MSDPKKSESAARPGFAPSASLERLRLRSELLARLRAFFAERGFWEVDTPLLSAEVVVDRHLEPVRVELDDGHAWLQTSPEAHMKRLVAAGAEAIYQVTRSFRAGERGQLHNTEFTIVEWYRCGDTMDDGMQLLSELCEALLARGPAERISYREAFLRHAKIDPLAAEASQLAGLAAAAGVAAPAELGDDRQAWLDLLLVDLVEPNLGFERPTIMYDWPASEAALARVRDEDPPVAERFELYVDGVELANGYHELTDAAELRRRGKVANQARRDDAKCELPEPSRLLAAMEHGLPACTGVALGFDRLVMLAAGAASIDEVMAFPIDRA